MSCRHILAAEHMCAEESVASGPSIGRMRLAICSAGEIWGGVGQCIVTLSQGLTAVHVRPIVILDLLVMPSLHEGLPYALLEAMYLKVPVIASRVGGLMEVIEDGRSGVFVIPRDDVALAAAIERLYWNPELRGRLAQEAFRTVCRDFLAAGM